MPAHDTSSRSSSDGPLARLQGESKKAKEASFLQRCVKRKVDAEGKFTSPESGMPIDANPT